jgi:hypothetical protein
MKIDRIKELFFSTNTKYPFPSNELYIFFGFNRHDNFIRMLNKDKYNLEINRKPWEKINHRRRVVYYLTRNLFYILCQNFLKDYDAITQIYLDYKRDIFKSKILNFIFEKRYVFSVSMSRKIKGHYHTYKLNTLNLSGDLDINTYDLFKFCSIEFCSKYRYTSARCTHEYGFNGEAASPYYEFDDSEFKELLKIIFKKFKLTDFQKLVIKIYSDFIKQMLDKQVEYDFKEYRRRTVTLKFNYIPNLTKEQKAEMKIIYRKAAMLCHPDKNKDGEEIFKNLNNANENNDLLKVKEIFRRLS